MFRDSLQQIINKADKERESKNFISRLQISDLEHQNKLQETSLANSHRMVVVSTTCAILFFSLYVLSVTFVISGRSGWMLS